MVGGGGTHVGEIPLSSMGQLTDDAFELVRMWVNTERSYVAVGMPERWAPELLGSLLVESVHTAAAAYAANTGMSEAEVLKRMWAGLDEERERLSNER